MRVPHYFLLLLQSDDFPGGMGRIEVPYCGCLELLVLGTTDLTPLLANAKILSCKWQHNLKCHRCQNCKCPYSKIRAPWNIFRVYS